MNVLMIYPEFPDTFWSFRHALSFINKKAGNPPLGLLTVAALLPAAWNKRLIDLNVQSLKKADMDWADLAMVSAMDIQREAVRKVISRCKENGLKVAAGGPLFTEDYQDFPQVDYFVLNEAEITIHQFINDLESGSPQHIYSTSEYADITQTPLPMWSLLDLKSYDSMAIQFSRGCPYNCDFCNVTALLGHRPRTKTAQQLVAELDSLYELGWRRNIFIVDDNFIGNKRILKEEVLPAIIEWRKGKKGCLFITEASINMADDQKLMTMMRQAGFTQVFIGVETPDEESLTECHKTQNRNRDLVENIHTLQRNGFQIMGGFIVGFDSDTPSIFDRQIKFIQESGIVTAMVGLLQAPFNTQLFKRLQAEDRLVKPISGDNTDGTSNIIPLMDPDLLHNGYQRLLKQIYSPKLFYQRIRTLLKHLKPPRASVHLGWTEIRAFFRSIWRLGILGVERWEYWKLVFWSAFTCPDKFPVAITMTIYGYHFRQVSQLHVLNQAAETVKISLPVPAMTTRSIRADGE
jgi:radical SAM superfamily enzyme YgiQ (UPF0313 family)